MKHFSVKNYVFRTVTTFAIGISYRLKNCRFDCPVYFFFLQSSFSRDPWSEMKKLKNEMVWNDMKDKEKNEIELLI